MRSKLIKNIGIALCSLVLFNACVNDLDVTPIDPSLDTPDKIFTSEQAFLETLTKIYAGFAVSGQKGPSGSGDLGGFDEGHSQYWRGYFVCQELPTDECVNGWNDGNLPQMSTITWGANNEYIRSFYYRALYQVSLANEFIRQAKTYGKSEYTKLPQYIAEARFLRALAYWHALDLFGNGIPFVTENDAIGSQLPKPAGTSPRGPELFNYIENELLEIVGDAGNGNQVLMEAATSYVGQANKGAAWALLSKLYLNHKVYLGTESANYYQKAKTYVDKIMGANYALMGDADKKESDIFTPYQFMFLADNHTCNKEVIFSINFDGTNTKSYGGTTYIINAAIGGDLMPKAEFGTTGGWGGNRTTKALVNKFESNDARALWFTQGQTLEITKLNNFGDGYAVTKYRNVKRDGTFASNEGKSEFTDTDAPVFRLADIYLMAAEIDLRLGQPVSTANLSHLQAIATRAGVNLPSTVNLDYILDERARELYWECHRRTDLIRFDKLTSGTYVWPLKGDDLNGKAVDEKFNLMPIPFTDIMANPNLKQNPKY